MHEHKELHHLIMELIGIFNHPAPDRAILEKAGISLDRALFPLVVRVGLYQPIGVVDLADMVGRDHSTISRQMAKLEELGLIARTPALTNKRISLASLTEHGEELRAAIEGARGALYAQIQSQWSPKDRSDLNRLLKKLNEDMRNTLQDTQ